jgi:hypothetical protein
MNHRSCYLTAALAAAVCLSTAVKSAGAQSRWMPRDGKQAVAVEFLHPSLEAFDTGFFNAATFVSARVEASPNFAIVGELPYASHKSSYLGTDFYGNDATVKQSSGTIGNLYLGFEAAPAALPIFLEFGLRLPLVNGDQDLAQATGLVADATRWEAFYYKVVSIQSAFNVREVTASNMEYRLRLSPVLSMSTQSGVDPELYGVYSLQIGYHGSFARIGTGLSGRVLVTEDFGNLGQRSLNQLEFHADLGPWAVRPGFDLHLPLDSWAENVPVVVGASLSWGR